MSSHTETVLDSIQVAANPTVPSDPFFLEDQLSEVIIYITNNGASTNLVVSCYSSPNGIRKASLKPFVDNVSVSTVEFEGTVDLTGGTT
jgi:hypothetical protein